MKNNNLISVIIPTYKGEKSIKLLCDEIVKKFNFINFYYTKVTYIFVFNIAKFYE